MAKETKSKIPRVRRFRGVVYIDRNLCKGCGFCVAFCPTQALDLSAEFNSIGYHPVEVVDAEACTGAGLCSAICPDFAIFARRVKIEPTQE